MLSTLPKILVITGHYGCGKTNLALNLAYDLRRRGKSVTLVDLDIVNPYFRSADHKDALEKQGIRLIAPIFANSNVDIPSLPADIGAVFTSNDDHVILDVGGDDAGATVLGRFAAEIEANGYAMLYAVNLHRFLTRDADETLSLLHDIEQVSRLKATALVNSSNLAGQTTRASVLGTVAQMDAIAKQAGLEVAFTALRRDLCKPQDAQRGIYPIDVFVTALWDA